MSDKDANHLILELQEARHLADSNHRAFMQANARCVELMDEVEKLRDLVRWRKWPDEVPDSHGFYVTTGNYFGLNYYHMTEGWQSDDVVWWKGIGPLPGGE